MESVPVNQDKINDILHKIDREKKLAAGASNLRKKTSNTTVIQRCNIQIREAQKNIEYLETTLQKLFISNQKPPSSTAGDLATTNVNVQSSRNASNSNVSPPKFTALDLLKYECPSLGHKIQYMMQLLEFKIQVEEQYREANEKMYNLYQVDGDKSSIAKAEGGRMESDQKLQLMKKSLKEYQSMYIDFDDVSRENAIINTVRKHSISGLISINIQSIRNVDHIQSPLFSKNPECIISIKVDDNERARTKGSRNDHWIDSFDIKVEKANELSITLYDKIGEQMIPVGLCWLPLSDVAEEIRRKKVSLQGNSNDWMSASNIQRNGTLPSLSKSTSNVTGTHNHDHNNALLPNSAGSYTNLSSNGTLNSNAGPIKASCWFNIEPHGEILVTLGFIKSTDNNKRQEVNLTGGLGRHGAIRQRKEDVIESQGHKFVQKQFYNVMACAVCGDFLRYTGYQCEDCRFLCHQKCIKIVIAKCISKSSTEIDTNEAKLNHRIPHRFIQVTNRGAKWCCHCGYILPFSRKNVRKCSECGIMCHAGCAHLVPDLCGIPAKAAFQILEAIKNSQKTTIIPPKQLTGSAGISKIPIPTKKIVKTLPITPKALSAPIPQVPHQKIEKVESSTTITPAVVQSTSPSKPLQNQNILSPSDQGNQYPRKAVVNDNSNNKEYDSTLDPFSKGAVSVLEEPVFLESESKIADVSIVETERDIPIINNVPSHQHSHEMAHRQHHHHREKRHRKKRYGLDDFKFLSVLGRGNFGKVMLAEYVSGTKLCAIKVLKKNFIIENDEVESTKSEKRVFLLANVNKHPFMLNLYQCFQTENRIYFVMEYISGGDLMWHVQQKRFSLRRAQFYGAEILLALKFLHENGVIYRDLKLDNILLTNEGHIKLADYGLCKENMWFGNKTKTFCGTPELMAPEIIIEESDYGKEVDWWAFGVLLYQMILTKTPFKGEDEEEVFNAILNDEPLYPITMAKESVDIIQKLLNRNPQFRLGSSERDALDIMEHQYFSDINFDDILNGKVQPPYIPNIKDPKDALCFEAEFTNQAAKLTPVNSVLVSSYQEMFRGFTYSCDDDL